MPTVLITGVSGFVATHVAQLFLENGWNVRGTVRTEAKGKTVAEIPAIKPFADKLSFAIVEDVMTNDFQEATKGVDAVVHTASPLHMNGKDWHADYKDPAVKGTENVLLAAKQVHSIKHVSVTSSFAAIGTFDKPAKKQGGKVYTEADHNPIEEDDVATLDPSKPVNANMWYLASKKFSEAKAWEVAKSASYELSTVCPSLVIGPAFQLSSIDKLNESMNMIYQIMKRDGSSAKELPETGFPSYVDVRDVAAAHYQAVVQNKGGRYLLNGGSFDNQRIADLAHKDYPQLKDRIAVGNPGNYLAPDQIYTLDGSKVTKELGVKYIDFDHSIRDTIDQLLEIEKKSGADQSTYQEKDK